MTAPITDLAAAVAALGALPMPAGDDDARPTRVHINHRERAEELRAQPGVWLPIGEYRTKSSAVASARGIRAGRWNARQSSPYTAGEFEPRLEMTEFGVRVVARYLGTQQQRDVDAFNARFPVGTPVTAYPGLRPEDAYNPEIVTRIVTSTRSRATVLSGHTAVVWVHGHSACIALSHIDLRTQATDQEAAEMRHWADPALDYTRRQETK